MSAFSRSIGDRSRALNPYSFSSLTSSSLVWNAKSVPNTICDTGMSFNFDRRLSDRHRHSPQWPGK
jgi:hypothetical protein